MRLNIVGGCYKEICDWPDKQELMGSAGRAVQVIQQLSNGGEITLHTKLDPKLKNELQGQLLFTECKFEIVDSEFTPTFRYQHPLAIPEITPEKCVYGHKPPFKVRDLSKESALIFGMIEAEAEVNADTVVYDPQNAISPKLFRETKCSAKKLALVLNHYEASSACTRITGQTLPDTESLADWVLTHQKADAVVIKCGKRGAYAKCATGADGWVEPYQTSNVYPIGSGDTFAAAFYFYWVSQQLSVCDAAKRASGVAAFYCDTKTYTDDKSLDDYLAKLQTYKPKTQKKLNIYLAGPFFTLAQMWLINETKRCLEEAGMKVFSPYHDVGVGTAEQVVQHDVNGIHNCDVVYALFDEHDPGTLFEIGMAIQAGKKVVILAENSTNEHLKMYEGTGCQIYKDFATSIYAVGWLQ